MNCSTKQNLDVWCGVTLPLVTFPLPQCNILRWQDKVVRKPLEMTCCGRPGTPSPLLLRESTEAFFLLFFDSNNNRTSSQFFPLNKFSSASTPADHPGDPTHHTRLNTKSWKKETQNTHIEETPTWRPSNSKDWFEKLALKLVWERGPAPIKAAPPWGSLTHSAQTSALLISLGWKNYLLMPNCSKTYVIVDFLGVRPRVYSKKVC